MNCLVASSINFDMAVLDVESRRRRAVTFPRRRSQDGPIPQDPPSRDVPHPGLGYYYWYVTECIHLFPQCLLNRASNLRCRHQLW